MEEENKDELVEDYKIRAGKPYKIIRQEFNGKDINKDLRLFEYKTEKNAQKLCDDINSRQNTKFKPVWVERS